MKKIGVTLRNILREALLWVLFSIKPGFPTAHCKADWLGLTEIIIQSELKFEIKK